MILSALSDKDSTRLIYEPIASPKVPLKFPTLNFAFGWHEPVADEWLTEGSHLYGDSYH